MTGDAQGSLRYLTDPDATGLGDYYYDAFGADRGGHWSQRSASTE